MKTAAMLAFGMVLAVLGCEAKQATTPGPQPTHTIAPSTQPAKELMLDLGNKVTMKLVLIPAGKFLMGSPETENFRWPEEVQHEVTISQPFYMGVTHVTVAQFAVFAKDSGYKTDAERDGCSNGFVITNGKIVVKEMVKGCSWRNPSFEQKGDHPVVQVSWNDAQAFCEWLSKKSGKMVRLPTEAEWEYTCRSGTTTAYPWGDEPDDGQGWANCGDQSVRSQLTGEPPGLYFNWDDGFLFTSPVGSYKANAFGLYDMIGNAYQWCRDRYGDYETGAVTDPMGANTGGRRVLRGGSWLAGIHSCRSAYRLGRDLVTHNDCAGFRVVVAGT